MPRYEIITESTTVLTYQVTASNEDAACHLLGLGEATFIAAHDATEVPVFVNLLTSAGGDS